MLFKLNISLDSSQLETDVDGYPSPSQENYLVIRIARVTEKELIDKHWNFKALKNYSTGHASALPFTSTLAELIRTRVR